MKELTATTFFSPLWLVINCVIALAVPSAQADLFKANIGISFPAQPGYGCQVEYKANLTEAAWIPWFGRYHLSSSC